MGDRSGSFGLAEEEEAAALDGVAAGAREVGGSGDSAEEDEPVPEGAEGSFFRLEAHSRLHVVMTGGLHIGVASAAVRLEEILPGWDPY